MQTQRATDPKGALHFRSDRITAINGQFFFATREGTLEGPYFTREDALINVEKYIECQVIAQAMRTGRPLSS